MEASRPYKVARSITVAATSLLLLFFALRVPLLQVEAFNPDEFEHLHASYSLAKGLVPYRDYFENHLPLLHFMLAPLYGLFAADRSADQAEALIFTARLTMWGLSALTALAVYWLGRLRSGHREGLVAAVILCGLSIFRDKGFEIRPDVPAVALLAVCLVALTAVTTCNAAKRRFWLLLASGACLALATLCTQKILFVWPGVGFVVASLVMSEAQGRRLSAMLSWLAGLVTVVALVGIWFAAQNAWAPFVDQNLLLNLRWKTHYSPLPALTAIWVENRPTVLLSIIGFVMALRTPIRTPVGSQLLPAVAAASVFIGAFIVPAPLEQYFLPLMPPLAWLAADGLIAVVRRACRGRRSDWLLTGALTVLLLPSLLDMTNGLRFPRRPARATLDQVRWVIDHTEVSDTVLDGFSGVGVFRPHAWFYFYPNEDIAPLIPEADVVELIQSLRDGETTPRLAVLDRELRRLDAELVRFLEANYEPTGTGDVWRLRDEPLDGLPFGGHLDVGAGPTDRLAGTGFYRPQHEGQRSFRLSRGPTSVLRLPLAGVAHTRLILHARLELLATPVSLVVKVNDQEIGRSLLEPGWRDYVFQLPPSLLQSGMNRVRLLYTKTPRDVPGLAGRNAVIALDSVRFE